MTDLALRHQRVLMLRLGLYDGRERTLAEIGESMHITRERVRQIEGKGMERLQGTAAWAQLVASVVERDDSNVLRAIWAEIDGFGDIVAHPMVTAQWLEEMMPILKRDVRDYRLKQARRGAFTAIWSASHPGGDRSLDEEFSDDEDGENEGDEAQESEFDAAYAAFALTPAQLDLVDLDVSRREAIAHVMSFDSHRLTYDGVLGVATSFAFGLRFRRERRRLLDRVVVGIAEAEQPAIDALGATLIERAKTGPDGRIFTDFLDFWADESRKYTGQRESDAAVALVWPLVIERDGLVFVDAAEFRARRDGLASEAGRFTVQELIWSGFGAWSPPQGLVTAVAEFRALHAAGLFTEWRHRRQRRLAAAERYRLKLDASGGEWIGTLPRPPEEPPVA
jgi:hypothetical protein